MKNSKQPNAATEAGRHATGGTLAKVGLPAIKKIGQTSGQSPTTGSNPYSQMHPTREANLQTSARTSAQGEALAAAPPAPFTTKFNAGAATTPSTSPNGSAEYITAGLRGKSNNSPVESQAAPVHTGKMPAAHAPSGALNQAKIGKGVSDSSQPTGKRGKRSAFFGE